jgi:hypothetical protein
MPRPRKKEGPSVEGGVVERRWRRSKRRAEGTTSRRPDPEHSRCSGHRACKAETEGSARAAEWVHEYSQAPVFSPA